MTNQCIMLIATVFIVIVSSPVSFGAPDPPTITEWNCEGGDLSGTLTNHDTYKTMLYRSVGKDPKSMEVTDKDGKFTIKSEDIGSDNKVTIEFGRSKLVTSKLEYVVDCSTDTAVVRTNVLDSPKLNTTTLYAGYPVSITLDPADIQLSGKNKITVILSSTPEKATLKKCEIIGNDVSPAEWISLHKCEEKSPSSFINNIMFTKPSTITATLEGILVPGSKLMEIRCELAECINTPECADSKFDTNYGTNGNCLP